VKNDSAEIFKASTTSALKAIARDAGVEVAYVAGSIPGGGIAAGNTLRVPLPDHNMDAESVMLVRGSADAQGLYHDYHDAELHQRNMPSDGKAAQVYNALEAMRCEAIGGRAMDGVAKNISAVLEQKCKKLGYDHAKSADDVPLQEALHLAGYYQMTGVPVPEAVQKSLAHWQEPFETIDWSALTDALPDQNTYSRKMRGILKQFGLSDDDGDEAEDFEQDSESQQEDSEGDENDEEDQEQSQQDDQHDHDASGDEESAPLSGTDEFQDNAEDYDPSQGESFGEGARHLEPGQDRGLYHIYTNQFDEIVDAAELADAVELTRLRNMLDQQLQGSRALVSKLANRLQRKIMAQQQRRWQFDLEEGQLDASRLARIIANPSVPLTFKQEVQNDERDTVVTILIDNSGSMRGRPIALAAMSADVIAQTLERCNVRVEILGFTTRAWKGGQAREHWIANGRPDNPGRLNDLRHIIYKAADAPMRRSRRNLGLMLKEGVLKENIDGEALAWAYNRLARRAEQRKILMVISDGAPVDDSTLSANSGNMLEADLRNVIGWIENRSKVEMTAIGIGHDVTRYYSRALTITDADGLAPALMEQLADLFEERST
jgi:cobaltochelatase CobT